MWTFLAGDAMGFGALIVGYGGLRYYNTNWPLPADVLGIGLTAFMTFVLICSSVTMVKAYAEIERGNQKGLRTYLLATVVLGLVFLGIQAIEYTVLSHEGFVPMADQYAAHGRQGGEAVLGGPLYGATFYTMTGFHGTHVSIGVFCMIFTTIKAFRGGYSATSYGGVEIMGLYWHFVDLVWIILFTIVYLI
jgi:heme/copper-type cytochrome/quinol oxidase subunit 3